MPFRFSWPSGVGCGVIARRGGVRMARARFFAGAKNGRESCGLPLSEVITPRPYQKAKKTDAASLLT